MPRIKKKRKRKSCFFFNCSHLDYFNQYIYIYLFFFFFLLKNMWFNRNGNCELRNPEACGGNTQVRFRVVQAERKTNREASRFQGQFQHQKLLWREWPGIACCCSLLQCAERDCCQKENITKLDAPMIQSTWLLWSY